MKPFAVVRGARVVALADTMLEALGVQSFMQRTDPGRLSIRLARPNDSVSL